MCPGSGGWVLAHSARVGGHLSSRSSFDGRASQGAGSGSGVQGRKGLFSLVACPGTLVLPWRNNYASCGQEGGLQVGVG